VSSSAPTATQPTAADPLSERELGAWRGLLRTHAMLVKRLDAELEAEHALALTSYEVLLHLSHAEERKMRMCDVAESVLLSRSGLTRLVDRLERDGFVERVSCADDARGAYAQLTDAGHTKLREAQRTHLAGVREHFLRHFAQEELDLLGDAWLRVTGAAAQQGPGCESP
jgi:DNA-binding MarR family transcriptional regulator